MLKSFCQDIYHMLCQKYPNQKIYIIGDHHFMHRNIISYTRNNFNDVIEMNEYIIKKHNQKVNKDDIVIFLGDFSFKKDVIKDFLHKMNGHKYLIIGNHDAFELARNYPLYGLEGVFTSPIKINENYLSHEPLISGERSDNHFNLIVNEFQKESGKINYHGHVHTNEFIAPNYINAACEQLDYEPLLIGVTQELLTENEQVPFINSSYLDKILTVLYHKHNIQPAILLSDYLYSTMLETMTKYHQDFFVQGSYGLLKKYNFMTNISDLDVSFLYDYNRSKKMNTLNVKNIIDEVYEELKIVEGINLSFVKRYSSLRIFSVLYTSKMANFASSAMDANLIRHDSYCKIDFCSLEGQSIIERFLPREYKSLKEEYHFPHFNVQTLTVLGDAANLFLQIIFQEGQEDKKLLALRKLKYIFKQELKNADIDSFSNIFIRLFLRNISFLATMNRFDEIEYIKNLYKTTPFSSSLYADLESYISEVLNTSEFMNIYEEISCSPNSSIDQKCSELVRLLK